MDWVKKRLGEHSTQVALGAACAAGAAYFTGQMDLNKLAIALFGCFVTIVLPAKQA